MIENMDQQWLYPSNENFVFCYFTYCLRSFLDHNLIETLHKYISVELNIMNKKEIFQNLRLRASVLLIFTCFRHNRCCIYDQHQSNKIFSFLNSNQPFFNDTLFLNHCISLNLNFIQFEISDVKQDWNSFYKYFYCFLFQNKFLM
ncbi:hypothetical protein MXB_4631 [Myxobolus squamalis]|nr:hypothetical protein MXB_4631 [Myxobolus squamalis]